MEKQTFFLHPRRHVPPTNPNNGINMSPVEGCTFSNCLSMQNIQLLTQTGGVNKNLHKHVIKLDEQHFTVVRTNYKDNSGSSSSSTKSTFLHDAKMASSKIQEDKNREKNDQHPQDRHVSDIEMKYQILRHLYAVKNLVFVSMSTVLLEHRAIIKLDSFVAVADGAQSGSATNDIRSVK